MNSFCFRVLCFSIVFVLFDFNLGLGQEDPTGVSTKTEINPVDVFKQGAEMVRHYSTLRYAAFGAFVTLTTFLLGLAITTVKRGNKNGTVPEEAKSLLLKICC